MTAVRVGRRQRPAPRTQEYVRDAYRYVSPPMVVHTAWSEQLQRWLWMECHNEGVVEVHEERLTEMPVERLMGIHERARRYRARQVKDAAGEVRKREVKVGMDAAQVEEVKALLDDDAESAEFGNSVPGSRKWCAVARRLLGERYPFPDRRIRQAQAREPLPVGVAV